MQERGRPKYNRKHSFRDLASSVQLYRYPALLEGTSSTCAKSQALHKISSVTRSPKDN